MDKFELENIKINVSKDHRFGTDAILLADFAAPQKKDVVCDLCSGCGIIPLLMCRNKPPQKIFAVEIQTEAVELMQKSVSENKLDGIIVPLNEDLKTLSLAVGSVDTVTVNPPYYRESTGLERISKAQAIARHELMCSLDDVVKAAAKILKYGGTLKMCHIPDRMTDVFVTMRKYGIEPKKLKFIQSKADEQPWLFLISGKKGAKSGLNIENSLIMYKSDGTQTDALKKAYYTKPEEENV